MSDILALIFGTAPVMLALVWRNAIDRRRERADTVTATARAAVSKALGGESLVAVSTEPSRPEKSRKGLSASEVSTPTGALERRSASMATPFQTKLTG